MNFREVQDAVADWLNRDDLTSRIPTFINNAVLYLERRFNFQYMEALEEYVGVTSYTLDAPVDYKHLRFAYVVDASGNRRLLTHRDPKAAIAAFPNFSQNTGCPQLISTVDRGTSFILRPTPDAAYNIDLYYFARTPQMVGDYDSNWLTENAPDILIYGALLNSEPFLATTDLIPVWQARLDGELSAVGFSDVREGHLGSYQTISSSAMGIV